MIFSQKCYGVSVDNVTAFINRDLSTVPVFLLGKTLSHSCCATAKGRGVWGETPQKDTTCAPLLEVRGEKLEVRNDFPMFTRSCHSCGLERGKKQDERFEKFVLNCKKQILASCF